MPERIVSPYTDRVLATLQHQRGSNSCGPFTTATVIHALCGERLDGFELAQEMNRPAWRGPLPVIRRIPNWATFPWGMVDVFHRHGLQAAWRFLADPGKTRLELSSQKVLMPVIGSWLPLWSHVMTLLAWDAERGWGFANTQSSRQEISWLAEAHFLSHWRAMGNLLVEISLK